MRAPIARSMAARPSTDEAAAIVRSCVHCGFCNATCPTYQLTGDELEGPRGRIYLIKALLETGASGAATRLHLDQCLVCRNCETTCPSGVQYGRLLELMRPQVYAQTPGTWRARLLRRALLAVVPYRRRFALALAAGRRCARLLPAPLARHLPRAPRAGPVPAPVPSAHHRRRVVALGGCVQPVLNPHIDAAAAQVFDRAGIELVTGAGGGCCGALAHHLGDERIAQRQARANIDAWWPLLEAGAEAIVATSSGCGVQLKDYGRLLAGDARYRERAAALAARVRDPLELIDVGSLATELEVAAAGTVAVQAPCTLQHGQRLQGRLEAVLTTLGFRLAPVAESHLCCGSAGSYSLLHADTAGALRRRKLEHLERHQPQVIATANIGCQTHLAGAARVPVLHWLELVAAHLRPRSG